MDQAQLQERYSRQILFRPIGAKGQERLRQSRVAIVGMGALGTAMATQVVRAGVGFVRLLDRDIIEPSNLQRQALYDEQDALEALPKAIAAMYKLRQANRDVEIEAKVVDVTAQNAEALLSDVDVILDGTDNFQIRYLINDVAVKHHIPWAYGGAVSAHGTSAFFRPHETPCLVCLFGTDPGSGHDTCDTVGVIAPVVSVIASFQVAETLKYLTGNLDDLRSGLVYVDLWNNEMRQIGFGQRNTDCPCCGHGQYAALQAKRDAITVSMCGRRTIQVKPQVPAQLSLASVAKRLEAVFRVRYNEHLLRVELPDHVQITLFADGRALVHGIEDATAARELYARYIGM
ncbi:ThiF family adenylyltransferase [Sulfoacidibacillus thermotolerans]|uniref:Thiamine biosynthesis protein ThiF n=1 Tax=Sulfoacidibacillus thermotolerans TaxID=1765684 RepID=A0A2U3D6M4_SULT2|nr:ThiF family adenylyltransferase [Sulfoacidibacillus thermotolerans]PWI56911.1 thiamine biosynthesis protein ThiF [Sulfoacidibacillus thermotolerans]